MSFDVDQFMQDLIAKDPAETEFHQAVGVVARSLAPFIAANPKYAKYKILERMTEPERVIIFRVPWLDDAGEIHVNRGYRVEMNSAIGPYKGGIRFVPSANLGLFKFLAFDQTLKNSLTTLPMGGANGGADFDGVGRSDDEVMRFCQSFMGELFRHIGPNTDIPAGDVGVGEREIAYMFGTYKKLRNEFSGVLTGKGIPFGGSMIRAQAGGYGVAYFGGEMLRARGESFEGKAIALSGAGNVGCHLIEKVNEMGGKCITVADAYGYVYVPSGLTDEHLQFLKPLWTVYRRPIKDFADQFGFEYRSGRKVWEVPCDVACPTSLQNEITEDDAKQLLKNGCRIVIEGSNMSSDAAAVALFREAKILFAPGKASNSGGVIVSGLEMTQNSMRYNWTAEEVDQRLQSIIASMHETCVEYGKHDGYIDYTDGANVGGFVKVADAMLAQGVV